MGTKTTPGNFDCYDSALPDEPIFVLLARDPAAAPVIRYWAELRHLMISDGLKPESDLTQVDEARACADEMERYRKRRVAERAGAGEL